MLTVISFLIFTASVGLITWLIVRKREVKSKDGYFLAGRSLTFPFIAGSLLLTNLSTEQMVGLNGSAFTNGLSVMAWEVVAVVGLVLMALFFLPRFLRSGVATVPQYLEIRFDHKTSVITNFIFLAAYAIILLPIILYTGAVGLGQILDVQELLPIESPTATLWIIVWCVGIIGSIYALFGGLRTVAVSDTLNGIGLLTGGFMIVYFGLKLAGGSEGFIAGIENVYSAIPEKFNSVGGPKQAVPYGTLFSGVFFINVFYWCTNQQIIQRTFGASSLAEGQKGVLLTGALKLFGPMYLVLPGLIAFYLYKQGIIQIGVKANGALNADSVYGILVNRTLPPALTGFFAAVMFGAILSSFNSALNSTCTLFSLGLYKGLINKDASEKQVVASGKTFGWIMAIIAMCIAPLLAGTDSIFKYLQDMNGIYYIPILAVVVVGMLTRRVPASAANWALLIGVVGIAVCYFVPPFCTVVDSMNRYHFLGLAFMYLVLFMLVMGELKPRAEEFVQVDAKVVDMTSWRYTPHVAIALLIIVVTVYVSFANYSVLKEPAAAAEVVEGI